MDSHHRHRALQARALLTELPVQKFASVVGLEPTPLAMFARACVHTRDTARYTTNCAHTDIEMAEEVRLELTRPLLNPRFSRPLPLDRLGLLFQNCGAGIGNRNRINSLEGCVAASAYPQNRFLIC